MVKQGPCRHCGVTSTPLWRNGPPDKPVLCNACGSRWRTKGSLTNYTPLHARAEELDEYEDYKASRVRVVNVNKPKEVKLQKRKRNRNSDVVELGGDFHNYSHSYRRFVDDDTSNRSSSGSGVSNSESFGPFSSTVGSDLTGPEQSVGWEATVPSKKRTCFGRSKPSPIEKFTQELYTIWQEQQSYCPESPEEELLYESETPMVSVEIGHGSVLIKHPSEIAHEEDSEASSLSAEVKPYPRTEAHLRPATLFVHKEDKGAAAFQAPRAVKSIRISNPPLMNREQSYRNEAANVHDIQHLLGRRDSPLCAVDLNDIVNLEEFAAQFTTQEQQQLLKYLPKSDVERYPISLKSLFDDPLFQESLLSFQRLLAEGVFDLSFPNVEPDDCRNLRRLALSNPLKPNWVALYNLLKSKNRPAAHNVTGSNVMELAKLSQKSQKSGSNLLSKDLNTVKLKHTTQAKEFADTDRTDFHPKNIFAPPSENPVSRVTQPLHDADMENDQDLLLDVPSNYAFPQAELLDPNQCLYR
uniref:GATA transcription factor n=1 Tax=Kalanchoe fedtschenkoi TaxID=63787 RepID=A0A7N0V132_KALFE